MARAKLKLEMERLEHKIKQNPLGDRIEQLDAACDALKLLDVHQIAQEILSAKQQLFVGMTE